MSTTLENLTSKSNPTICIVAGEVSGDQLGAGLINQLKLTYPEANFVGIGGDLMRQAGCSTWFDVADLSYFGVVDVVKNLPKILSTISKTKKLIKQHQCDIYIGIDSPDFNLRVADYCKYKLKLKTVQYVSPSVWAWRQERVQDIKQAIDLVLCLLPFEVEFYQQHKVPAVYVGHRLANSLQDSLALDSLAYAKENQHWFSTGLATYSSSNTPQTSFAKTISFANGLPSTQQALVQLQQLSKPEWQEVLFPEAVTSSSPEAEKTENSSATELAKSAPVPNRIALLPGSRNSEISLILPEFVEGIKLALTQGLFSANTQIWLPVAKEKLLPQIKEILLATLKDSCNLIDLTSLATAPETTESSNEDSLSAPKSTTLTTEENPIPSSKSADSNLATAETVATEPETTENSENKENTNSTETSNSEVNEEVADSSVSSDVSASAAESDNDKSTEIAQSSLTTLNGTTYNPALPSLILVSGNAHVVLKSSTLAIVASGTATLDTMLCHIPMVVGYKLKGFNYWLAKRLIKTPYVALANILCKEELAKELIQDDLTAEKLVEQLTKLADYKTNFMLRQDYFLRHLGLITNADQLAAQAVVNLLNQPVEQD